MKYQLVRKQVTFEYIEIDDERFSLEEFLYVLNTVVPRNSSKEFTGRGYRLQYLDAHMKPILRILLKEKLLLEVRNEGYYEYCANGETGRKRIDLLREQLEEARDNAKRNGHIIGNCTGRIELKMRPKVESEIESW